MMDRGDQAPPGVPELLANLGQLYRERNPTYGDNYRHAGKVLRGMFPTGIMLRTEEEFNRFHLVVMMLSKISRYSRCVRTGGHADSLDDLSVYAMMARECDRDGG
jgi:hypothetical protein